MRQLESDFDKAVKRLRNKKDKDKLKSKSDKENHYPQFHYGQTDS